MGDSALASGMRGQDISPCSMQSRVLLCWGRGEGIQGVESVNKTSHEWQAWMVAAKKPSFESRRLLSLIVSLVRCSLVWSNGKDLAQEPSQLGLLHEHQQEQTPRTGKPISSVMQEQQERSICSEQGRPRRQQQPSHFRADTV